MSLTFSNTFSLVYQKWHFLPQFLMEKSNSKKIWWSIKVLLFPHPKKFKNTMNIFAFSEMPKIVILPKKLFGPLEV